MLYLTFLAIILDGLTLSWFDILRDVKSKKYLFVSSKLARQVGPQW